MKLVELLDEGGGSPFGKWFAKLPAQAAARVTTSLTRLELGNFSNCKAVGQGVHEVKIYFGPGYRVYFANDGEVTILLLFGGSKKRQTSDIVKAQQLWSDYKKRKGF